MRLALLMLGLAALISWSAAQFSAAPPGAHEIAAAQRGAASATATDANNTDAAPPPAPLAATPLFRPAQPPTETTGPPPGEDFVLVGIAGDRENRLALVRDLAEAAPVRVRVGDAIAGWRVEEIDSACVSLRRRRTDTKRLCG